MAEAAAKNLCVIQNPTPEEVMARKRDASLQAVANAVKYGVAASPSEVAVMDPAPEDFGLTGDAFTWTKPATTGWTKSVDSVQVKDKVIVIYGVKSKDVDPVVGIRFTQGQGKDLQIRGEFNLYTIYNNVEREAVALFPEPIIYTKDEYMNIYLRFASAAASGIIPLAVVAKKKSQVIGV